MTAAISLTAQIFWTAGAICGIAAILTLLIWGGPDNR